MRILFAKNDKWYSKATMWLAKEPCSHIALLFYHDDHWGSQAVIEATKPAGRQTTMKRWCMHYNVVFALEIDLPPYLERMMHKAASKAVIDKGYDWPAYCYLWLWGIRRLLFGGPPYPKLNPWNTPDKMICTEIMVPLVPLLKEHCGIDLSEYDFAAATPWLVSQLLRGQKGVENAYFKNYSCPSRASC